MPPPALFGIDNDTVNAVVNLLILFLVVLWLALVFYTYTDAKRRIADPLLVGCATAASLFPFVGTIVYLILRPPEFLEDVRERELEIAAAEARLLQIHESTCPYCAYPVERSFLRCPSCLRRLREPCASCRKPLDPRWKICPYCEAEVGAEAPQRRRQRISSDRQRAPVERAPASDRATGDRLAPGGRVAGRVPARREQGTAGRPGEERTTRRPVTDGAPPSQRPAPAEAPQEAPPPAFDRPTTVRPTRPR